MPTTLPIHPENPLPQSVCEGCTRCGKCCTNASFMLTQFATPDDIRRCRREGRSDILRYAAVFQEIGAARTVQGHTPPLIKSRLPTNKAMTQPTTNSTSWRNWSRLATA